MSEEGRICKCEPTPISKEQRRRHIRRNFSCPS
jgi:hypothetical protein